MYFPRLSSALVCVCPRAATLAGCGSSYDPSFSRRPRFQTSAPLINPKRDPSFLAYAVPETELHHFPATRSAEFAVHGIDVSKYQGNIDWEQVKDAGVSFAFIKATEGGDRVDSKFAYNWAAAKAAGVPRGAYHFVYWCRQPHEEIGNFASVVPNEPDALPPVLDVEATPTSGTCKRTLYREEVLRDMKDMLTQMERHYGKKPIIYSSVDFYQAILHSNALSEYPIWVRSTKYHPTGALRRPQTGRSGSIAPTGACRASPARWTRTRSTARPISGAAGSRSPPAWGGAGRGGAQPDRRSRRPASLSRKIRRCCRAAKRAPMTGEPGAPVPPDAIR